MRRLGSELWRGGYSVYEVGPAVLHWSTESERPDLHPRPDGEAGSLHIGIAGDDGKPTHPIARSAQ
jgi:hypothetical protein